MDGANLTWSSIVSRKNTVQYSTDIDEWIDLITVPSFDVLSNTNFTEPGVEGGNCFYRVALVA